MMRSDNLGRWVDELAASIEDIERRINKIQAQPTPSSQYQIDDLISGSAVPETSGMYYAPTGIILGEYFMFMVTVFNTNNHEGHQSLFFDATVLNSEDERINEMPCSGSVGTFVISFNYSNNEIFVETEEIASGLSFTPYISIKGVKSLIPVTRSRSLMKKAADAVKKILRKEDK